MRAARWLGCLLLLLLGCRHLPPDLRPPKQAESLTEPPVADARYQYPVYPKEAYKDREREWARRGTPLDSDVMPTKGGMMGAGVMPGPGRAPY